LLLGHFTSAAGVIVLLNLQELELRPVKFDVDLPAGQIEFDNQLKQSSDLRAKGVAELVNSSIGEVRIRGHLTVTMEAPCDRCLETASIPIEKDFDLAYFPADQFEDGGEKEIDDEASEVAYYQGSQLDLDEILREVVLLTLPMQRVCSDDCKGICPVCGQNRNLQECRCSTQAVDDRWSKLRTFRSELSHGH
jgi:uncharacterized protein